MNSAVLALLALMTRAAYISSYPPEQRSLVLHDANRPVMAPLTDTDQIGFSDVHISSNSQLIGWLTVIPNCCATYPITWSLVVSSHGKIVGHFREEFPIFRWQFTPDGSAIAYQIGQVHGCGFVGYKLRRVSDGALLGEYECSCESSTNAPAPNWVSAVAWACPELAH